MKLLTSLLLTVCFLLTACNTKTKKTEIEITATPETELITESIEPEITKEVSMEKETNTTEIVPDTKSTAVKEVKKIVDPISTKNKKEPEIAAIKDTKPAIKTEETPKNTKIVPDVEEKIITTPNHNPWNTLTKNYVSASGKVNYKGFKSEIAAVDSYLLHLQNTVPNSSWSKNEKLAYWFNLYNASTVSLVAKNYPINSIKDLEAGKPWDKKFIKSGNNIYSLNDIENTIVRPNYNEPRLHVAFNCAAVSCPNLLNEAFMPNKLNSQLTALSKKWINDASKNNISSGNIKISQIFDWYKIDFKQGVIPFINKYTTKEKVNTDANITFLEYDWKLND